MDYNRLKFYIDQNANALLGLTPQETADWFNAVTVTRSKPYFVSERTLMALFGLQESTNIMEKIKTVGAGLPAMARLYDMLTTAGDDQGIDVGHPTARATVPGLVDLGVVTQEQADTILALGQETVSYATSVDLGYVLPGHIFKAGALG